MESTDMKVLTYEDAQVGFEFPEFTFTITEGVMREYAEILGDTLPLFGDPEAAKQAGFAGIVAAPTFMNIYAHFIKMMSTAGWVRPSESFHASSEFEFLAPVYPGDILTSTMKVEDKFQRRQHKYMSFRIETFNQRGDKVATKVHTSVWVW